MTTVPQQRPGLLPLRPELIGKSPYGAPQIDVPVRLNTNENPFPPSLAVRADIQRRIAERLDSANRYPDRDATELRSALAAYLTSTTGTWVTDDQVWAANGSNETLQHVLQAFGGPGRTALGFEPTYSMHRTISEATGTRYIAEPRNADMTIDPRRALAAIRRHRPDVVFVCTPNNPTGTSTQPHVIDALYDAAPGLLIVDEAYMEFSAGTGAIHLLEERPRLVISRTMSKAFGFAGVRAAYLAASAALVDALKLVRLPYHLSSLTQAAALGALAHHEELLATVGLLRLERDRVADQLEGLGYAVHRSDANFILFGGLADPTRAWRALVERGVLIRDVGIPGCLRVSVGTPSENDQFLNALKESR